MMNLKVRLLHPDAKPPQRATDGAAGYDLFAVEDYRLDSGERYAYRTGVAVEIPPGYVGIIKPRSGWAVKSGIDTLAGVIDSDFRGEIKVLLICLDRLDTLNGSFRVNKGDRIAQLLIVPCFTGAVEVVTELAGTERGAGGFGSTGK